MSQSLELSDLPASEQSYAEGEGRPIFEAFSDPTMLTRLRTAALAGIPGGFGAIELAEANLRASDPNAMWDDRKKKFLGRCAALLWRKNGFKTAGFSRRMPHPSFTVGEVYDTSWYAPLGLAGRGVPSQATE